MDIKYIDIHCHPNLGVLKGEQESVIARMKEKGIGGIVVGVDAASSAEAVALAERHEHLWATIGLHPNDTPAKSFEYIIYDTLVRHPKVVAIGECGIDYYRIDGNVEAKTAEGGSPDTAEAAFREKKKQWEIFEMQAAFALAHGKPMMIHCRPSKGSMDAYLDMLAWLEPRIAKGEKHRGNMHFFVGDLEVAQRFWAIGFTTSYTGILTFTHDYDEVVKAAPIDMLMVETDAPWAAPMPYRGQTNYPSYVPLVVSAISRIRNEPEEQVRAAVLNNAQRVFNISV